MKRQVKSDAVSAESQICAKALNVPGTPEMTIQSAGAALPAMERTAGEVAFVDNDSQGGWLEKMTNSLQEKGWKTGRVHMRTSGLNRSFRSGNKFANFGRLSTEGKRDYIRLLSFDAWPEPRRTTSRRACRCSSASPVSPDPKRFGPRSGSSGLQRSYIPSTEE